MKIAIVSDAIYPYNKGGKEVRIFELSTRLAKAHDVHIYTMKWWNGPEKIRVENGLTLHAISPLMPLYKGERRSIKQGLLFGVSTLALLKERFDVVDVDHMPYFPLFFMKLVCVLKRKPMIATWHEVWGMKYWIEYLGPAGIAAGLLEKLTVAMPSKIIAASSQTAGLLKSSLRPSQALTVVPNGINIASISRIAPHATSSDLIYVGRLLEHKNIDLLLHSVVKLKKANPNITCLIIGDGPERANLEQLSAKLGLQNNVTFLGFVPKHSQVYGYMKSSKVFVSPSTREGFGISVLEANACGLPVVVIDHPANAATSLVTNLNGRLAKMNAAHIARQTTALLNTPTNRKTITAHAAPYDWKHALATLQEVYGS